MVWGCIADQGAGGLHFVQGTVNAQVYIGILEKKLLPTIWDHFTSVQKITLKQKMMIDKQNCSKQKMITSCCLQHRGVEHAT